MCAALSPDTVAVCQLELRNGCGDGDGAAWEWHVIEARTRLSREDRDDLQPPPTTMTLGAIVDDPLGYSMGKEKRRLRRRWGEANEAKGE